MQNTNFEQIGMSARDYGIRTVAGNGRVLSLTLFQSGCNHSPEVSKLGCDKNEGSQRFRQHK